MKSNMKRDTDFLYEMGCFRFVDRVWRQYFRGNLENNAEHSFRVMWISLMLARYEGAVNHEKILKMAMFHDVSESRTGDVHIVSRLYTKRDEDGAIKDIFSDTIFSEEFNKLWEEYEKRESIESKIVKDADTLDADLEIMEQSQMNPTLAESFKQQRRERVYPRLHTESAKKLFDEIYATDPGQWVLLAKNRFNSGDWKSI